MRIATLALALALLAGCDDDAPQIKSYKRPEVRPGSGDRSCLTLASGRTEARLVRDVTRLTIGPSGRLAIDDASTIGGPHPPPLEIAVPEGTYPLHVVVDKLPSGERPRCALLELSKAPAAKHDVVGSVAIDTDMVALVDPARALPAVRKQPAVVWPAVEAPEAAMPGLSEALASRGLTLVRSLPTLYRGTREHTDADRDLVRETLKARDVRGAYSLEPRPGAFAFADALGAGAFAAPVPLEGAEGAAVVVDSGAGDGAYVVAAGKAEDGALVHVEIRLF